MADHQTLVEDPRPLSLIFKWTFIIAAGLSFLGTRSIIDGALSGLLWGGFAVAFVAIRRKNA